MDRIINVKVGGNHLSKDSKNAGVRGEANVTKLRITFDEGWDGYAKTVTFFDAHGNNPVKRIQGVDLIEDIINDTRTYVTPIPQEPLAIAGELTFVIDGYLDGKRQRSLSDKLVVKDAPDTDNVGEPTDPTPSQAEQLQSQIDTVINTIQNAAQSATEAKESADKAKEYEGEALECSVRALEYASKSEDCAIEAKKYCDGARQNSVAAFNAAGEAEDYVRKAEEATTRNPIIVGGYWHVWSATDEKYIDTGVKAQSGSEVYIGANPPDTADVIIDPEGESALYAPYIGENGNWYTFNPETQTFTDSGNRAVAKDGDKGEKGDKGDKGEQGISCSHSWNGTTLTIKSASGTSSANLKGERGEKGDKGDVGKNGVSPTHYWNGSVLTVTSASGTSSANLKGAKGDKGDTGEKGEQGERGLQGVKGEDGHTPVKGEDYFTDDEKTEIANEVSAEIEAELNAALLAIIAIEEEILIPDGNEVAY